MAANAITKSTLRYDKVISPAILSNEANINNITALSIDISDESDGNEITNETYDLSEGQGVELSFYDAHNGRYLVADETCLINGSELEVRFSVPGAMGEKLVCRYLVLDFRKVEGSITTTWPDRSDLGWIYGLPTLEGGNFYVIAFQRFKQDLILGNLAVQFSA